jgi:hypothetical protein
MTEESGFSPTITIRTCSGRTVWVVVAVESVLVAALIAALRMEVTSTDGRADGAVSALCVWGKVVRPAVLLMRASTNLSRKSLLYVWH